MTRQLTVHTAEITTAAVQIKTLTISGKQVTLAVFRQLQEAPLIADDGTLNGTPWGWVNHHPDKCGNPDVYPDHYHVVWQEDMNLFRAKVDTHPGRHWGSIHTPEGDRFVSALVALHLLGHDTTKWFAGQRPWDKPPYVVQANSERFAPWDSTLWPTRSATDALEAESYLNSKSDFWLGEEDRYIKEVARRKAAETTRDELARKVESWGVPIETLYERYLVATTHEYDRRQRHLRVREALADLPQLFIAV